MCLIVTIPLLLFSAGQALRSQEIAGSPVIEYHSFTIENTDADMGWADTVSKTYTYPQITGLADTDQEKTLNRFLRSLVRDSSNLWESERIVPARTDDHFFQDIRVVMLCPKLMSFVDTNVDPGGAHPVTWISSMTIDFATLRPVDLDSLFTEGYPDVFREAVLTSVDRNLLTNWLAAAAHQYDGRGMVVTDTAIVLGRDTEMDFHLGHGGREFSEVVIPYRILRSMIRTDGPLGRFVKE